MLDTRHRRCSLLLLLLPDETRDTLQLRHFAMRASSVLPRDWNEVGPSEVGPSSPHFSVRPSARLSVCAEAREELRDLATTHTATQRAAISQSQAERPTQQPSERMSKRSSLPPPSAMAPPASVAFLFLSLPAILGCSVTLARCFARSFFLRAATRTRTR